MLRKLLLHGIALATVVSPLLGQRADELYAPAPPPDAAFVRLIHAAAGASPASLSVGSKLLDKAIGYGRSTPYAIVGQGKHRFSVSLGTTLAQDVPVKAGAFYTFAVVGNGKAPRLILIEDTKNANLAKAQIALYNLSGSSSVELKTADQKTSVIPRLDRDSVKAIAVNPIRVSFGVLNDGKLVSTIPPVALTAASSYSVIVTGAPENLQVHWVVNTTTAR